MDIKASHPVKKLPAILRCFLSGKQIAYSKERCKTVLFYIVPEGVMVLIRKKQLRTAGFHKFLHIAVHNGIIRRNTIIALSGGIHGNCS